MLIEIPHRWTREIIYQCDCGTMAECVKRALEASADLTGADLPGADLRGANGVHRDLITPLRMLLDQPGAIRAYKLATSTGDSPLAPAQGHGQIHYEVGQSYQVADADTDETMGCGAGINLATLDWCLREWKPGYRVLIAEFTSADIAAIPIASDGKFRVFRCRIVGEKDLASIGWPVKQPKAEEVRG